MDVVMFHSGEECPVFLKDTFKQLRLFNPDINVYFITDKIHLSNPIFKEYNIGVYDKNDYHSVKIDRFEIAFKYRHKSQMYQFWVYTAIRLIYIEKFMRSHKMLNVIHFENDILLYSDLSKYNSLFSKLYPNMAITVGGFDKCITGMMFIKNYQALERMTDFFVNKLEHSSKANLMKTYKLDMVNEMTLMRAYSIDYPDQLEFLPILPFGKYSKWYEEFDSIFDPASWGQFVGGNAQEKQPGLKPEDHYIGQLLREHPEYTVIWKEGIPYFKYDGQEVKINNLHIHSKNLHLYLS